MNKFHKISTWILCLFNLLWWGVLNLFWWCVCFRAAANTYNVSNLKIYSAFCSNLSNPLTATLAILKQKLSGEEGGKNLKIKKNFCLKIGNIIIYYACV